MVAIDILRHIVSLATEGSSKTTESDEYLTIRGFPGFRCGHKQRESKVKTTI